MATFDDEWRPGSRLIAVMRACGLEEWRPGELLIYVLHFCGVVALVGGVLLALLGVLGGSPARLDAPYDNLGLIQRGGEIALAGMASWALSRLLGRR
jgi:hypothetical protein